MSENIFYTKFSELSGNRIDPFYYIPELVALEKQVRKVSKKRLRDFVLSVSSGATPKKSVTNEYYAEDEKDGIPFLRVQNLTQYGKLDFKGLKFITQATHEGMLKRSQVEEDDLLVKITGVGRMAIASVPEKGFAGNTNQHMVVIKTKDRKTSETLATYLNLDIVEKLASRRATGGTRPALDYPALLSIPIIYDEIIVIKLQDAYKQKEQKEKEAQNKLESIDKYLLQEIGIELSSDEKACLEDRVFVRKFSEISTKRFDASSNSSTFSFSKSRYTLVPFTKYISIDSDIGNIPEDTLATFLPMEKISDKYAEADLSEVKNFDDSKGYTKFKNNDLLWSKITPCMENGKSVVVENLKSGIGFGSTEYFVFRANNDKVNIKFIHALLRLKVFRNEAKKFFSGTAGHQRVSKDFFNNLKIPLPSIEEQSQIATHIQRLIGDSRALKDEAMQIYEDAKKEVEKMILGEVNE